MSNINEGNANDEGIKRTEDEANRRHRSHRSATIVSSGSSLDSFLMDFQGGADFLDGINEALDRNEISDVNREDNEIDDPSQFAMHTSTVSSGSLHDPKKGYTNASTAAHDVQLQRASSSDQHVLSTPSSAVAASSNVPEFLYQLTKMLSQDNREVIEWSNGRIEVHNPSKLEREVLNKYFRHSKFSSFQRQLNYFGFRKLAGKGKMAPCSYVNDAAGDEVASLLHIKRKGTVMNPRESTLSNKKKKVLPTSRPEGAKARPRRDIGEKPHIEACSEPIARKLKSSSGAESAATAVIASLPHHALARRAVGRGVRHSYAVPTAGTCSGLSTVPIPRSNQANAPKTVKPSTVDGLSELAINYCNVLNQGKSSSSQLQNTTDPTPLSEMQRQSNDSTGLFGGFLSRNSSLVDLAMIAPVDSDSQELSDYLSEGFGFIDFPNPDVHPANRSSTLGDKT